MRIGVIGAGNLGATAARLFVRAGHEVALARSRGPEGLGVLVAELGPRAHATTVEHAARFGEVVLVAVPFERYRELPAQALAGKIVIDAMNHYPSSGDGFPEIAEGATTSSGLLAAHLRDARVVKAFNTMYWKLLAVRGRPPGAGEERLALFLAGDHDEAKELVAGLIEEAGFTPVDSGDLAEGARRQQPGAPIYTELARRRKEGGEPPGLTEQEARAALGRPTARA
jgi:8-hydroxy-5-deazaflavin:NADPH oxidoreductase